MKGRLSFCSNSFERASPGGVMKSPGGLLDHSFCGVVSADIGRGWLGSAGMKTRLEVESLRFFGGRYMPFRVVSAVESILSTLIRVEEEAAFRSSSLTYSAGFM